MAKHVEPVTLRDLLDALARSNDLRALARECGLTVKELRRRLQLWSIELGEEADQAELAATPGDPTRLVQTPAGAGSAPWPELTPAEDIERSPLPRRGSRTLEAWTDGASRGNPGPAAIGIVFRQKNGSALCGHSEVIGHTTNNVAEYRAVMRALEFCRQWRIKRLDLYLDSELIARQLVGTYQVKSQMLRPLYQQAIFLARELQSFQVQHVPRTQNGHADHLANVALNQAR
jgi:ribonuclease HI